MISQRMRLDTSDYRGATRGISVALALAMAAIAAWLMGSWYGWGGSLLLGGMTAASCVASILAARRGRAAVAVAHTERVTAAEQNDRLAGERDELRRIANSDTFDARLGNRRRFEADVLKIGPDDLLVLGDISGLKVVNDTIGHPAGDVLLAAVGGALQATARSRGTAYRFTNGDEYALIMWGFPVDRVAAILSEIDEQVADAVAAEPVLDGARTWLRTGCAHGHDGVDSMRQRAEAQLVSRWREEHGLA